jgi:hypothetical protein
MAKQLSSLAAILPGMKKEESHQVKTGFSLTILYSRYHVADVININGAKLYSRQGTSFDVRLILINGRKQAASGAAPVYNPDKDHEVKTFDELFERVMDAKENEMPDEK